MLGVARLPVKDRGELFMATARKMGLPSNVVEKDFWVCFMLDHLFHDCFCRSAFVFKGGTSLSKSYHVIERFSEDIDLILDWREFMNDSGNPWDDRSKTKQDQYNKRMNADSVKARLKNFAVETGHTFQEALTYYGLERTIYRISVSRYAEHSGVKTFAEQFVNIIAKKF